MRRKTDKRTDKQLRADRAIVDPLELPKPPPPMNAAEGKKPQRIISEKVADENIRLLERRAKAIALLKSGLTYDQIAHQLGYSDKSDACRDVRYELRELIDHCRHEAAEHVALQNEKLIGLEAQLNVILRDPKTTKSMKVRTAGMLLKVFERHAKLYGYDAPTKTEMTGRGGGPIEIDWGALEKSPELLQRLKDGDFTVLAGQGADPGASATASLGAVDTGGTTH